MEMALSFLVSVEAGMLVISLSLNRYAGEVRLSRPPNFKSDRANILTTTVTIISTSPIALGACGSGRPDRLGGFIRNHTRQRITGCKNRCGNDRSVSNQHRYRHGFAKSSAESENHRAKYSGPRVAQDCIACDLPTRCA